MSKVLLGNQKLIIGENSLIKSISLFAEIIRDYGPAGSSETCLIICGKSFFNSSAWQEFKEKMDAYHYKWLHCLVSGEPQPQTIDSIVTDHRSKGIALILAIGGGSVLDAGKAVAAMLCEEASVFDYLEGLGTRIPSGARIPLIAVPTTAGTGSEATKNAVIGIPGPQGFKKSLRHQAYVPQAAILDPSLLLTCPQLTLVSSGLDAITQLVEAFLSTKANATSDGWTKYGLTLGLAAFQKLCISADHFNDKNERLSLLSDMLLAAYLSGLALAQVGLGTVHGIAGPLGAYSGISHGIVCARLLSPVLEQGFALLKEQNPNSVSLQKAAWIGRNLSTESELDDELARITLCESILSWNTLAEIPRLRSLGLEPDIITKVAQDSDDKQSPWKTSQQQRRAMILEAY